MIHTMIFRCLVGAEVFFSLLLAAGSITYAKEDDCCRHPMTCRIHRVRFEKDTLVKAGMVGYGLPRAHEVGRCDSLEAQLQE